MAISRRSGAFLVAAAMATIGIGVTACSAVPAASGSATSLAAASVGATTEVAALVDRMVRAAEKANTSTVAAETTSTERSGRTTTLTMTGAIESRAGGATAMSAKMTVSTRPTPQAEATVTSTSDVIFVDHDAYVREGGTIYTKIDTATLRATMGYDPSTPAAQRLRQQLSGLTDVAAVGEENVGTVKTVHYRATMDLARSTAASGKTLPSSLGDTRTAQYDLWLDGHDNLRQSTLTIRTDAAISIVNVTQDHFGEPVDITAPPSSIVTAQPKARQA